MGEFIKLMRRKMIRLQLRSLDQQAAHIIEARNCALARLIQIRHEQDSKEAELSHCEASLMGSSSAY